MSAATVRGWCPSLHEPMAALDGLIVRVKPFVRGLSAADLECIAAVAEQAGAGGLELTGRGALQVRGLGEGGAEMFAGAMVEAGLASADPAVERRRNIQLGVGCGPNLLRLAAALEAWLAEDASLAALPAKFGFAVSPVEGMAADIVVVGEEAGSILIGGEVAIGLSTVPDAVQRLTCAFIKLAPLQPTPPRRMKGLIQAVGAAAVLEEAGLQRPSTDEAITDVAVQIRGPTIGPSHDGYGLGVVFGVLTPSALRTAAALATRHGDGRVRLASGRVIWLDGVPSSAEAQIAREASAAGFVVDPHDRRLRLDACVGRAGCARASEDVRAAALRLASAAPATGLHVSGCAKGCAHPSAAGVTLVSRGVAGRYDMILDGAPSAPPTLNHASLDEIADHLSEPAL
jgi:precorrin-3B synthase